MAEEMGKNEDYLRNVVGGSHKGSHCKVEEDSQKTSLSSLRNWNTNLVAQKAGA
jgi:hypothetical protein